MQQAFACAAWPPVLRVLLAVVFVSGAGQAPPRRKREFNDDQKAALDNVSAYLNGIHTLKSGFIQLGPDGQLDQGEFLLEKPGKLRFAYNPPNPTLIVATGGNIYVKNTGSTRSTITIFPTRRWVCCWATMSI